MIKYLKEISTGFFILLVAFSYSIYFIIQAGVGLPTESSLFQIYSGVLTIITLLFYIKSIRKISDNISIKVFLTCTIIILLFFMTRLYYGYTNYRYQSYFLSMGVRFIPSVLIGAYMLSDSSLLPKVEKALLPFIGLYTTILAQVILTAKVGANIASTFNIEGGMNYQNMSYYSIYIFGLTLYTIINGKYPQWFRYALTLMAFLQVTMTIMTGGRGAFVLGVIFMLYYGLRYFSPTKIVILSISMTFLYFIIQPLFSENIIFQTGFNRIFNFFSDSNAVENDNRWIRWGLAYAAFLKSPLLGHGLGSVFYEVGFYSHNIFTDMLCEGGIILTSIFLLCLYSFYKRSKYWIKTAPQYEIIVIIFLCSFIMSCFSGYYWSDSGLWFALTYILLKPSYRKQ